MRRYSGAVLAGIVLLAVVGGLFIYPNFWGFRPWRLGLDLVGGSNLVYEIDLSSVPATDRDGTLGAIRDVIERRVNLFGVSEPQIFIARSGERSQLIVQLAGVKEVSKAIAQIGETPLLSFEELASEGEVQQLGLEGNAVVTKKTGLTGRFVTGAQLSFDSATGIPQPHVLISFNDEGARLFEKITERNVGRPVAIMLDGVPISSPVVQQKIVGGEAVITGDFTVDEARKLVERFNAGALPAPIRLINQQTISATLGTDSLNTALLAGLIGTMAVALFMLIYYRLFGIFAAFALAIYIVLTLGVFKIIPVTMTLAGVAGFVLTIGMAVDANILIFERTKEEMKRGVARVTAIEEGFRRAWPSIRDSNITTIISAVILYFFTSSFVQGFALTLLIGTLMSMFSAITTTRLFLRVFASAKPVTVDR